MPYVRDWQTLSEALKYVMTCGADQDQAQRDLCGALSDQKITFRATIHQNDRNYGGKTLARGNVGVPSHLTPSDFDWGGSRPKQRWSVGPNPTNPPERYFSSAGWEPRTIVLIELCRKDVEKVFGAVVSPPAPISPTKPEEPSSLEQVERATKPRRPVLKRGRPSWAKADEPLLAKMKALVESGAARSAHQAAGMVAKDAQGAGTEESKQSRLERAYREKFGE
jgi:hypothetical protein